MQLPDISILNCQATQTVSIAETSAFLLVHQKLSQWEVLEPLPMGPSLTPPPTPCLPCVLEPSVQTTTTATIVPSSGQLTSPNDRIEETPPSDPKMESDDLPIREVLAAGRGSKAHQVLPAASVPVTMPDPIQTTTTNHRPEYALNFEKPEHMNDDGAAKPDDGGHVSAAALWQVQTALDKKLLNDGMEAFSNANGAPALDQALLKAAHCPKASEPSRSDDLERSESVTIPSPREATAPSQGGQLTPFRSLGAQPAEFSELGMARRGETRDEAFSLQTAQVVRSEPQAATKRDAILTYAGAGVLTASVGSPPQTGAEGENEPPPPIKVATAGAHVPLKSGQLSTPAFPQEPALSQSHVGRCSFNYARPLLFNEEPEIFKDRGEATRDAVSPRNIVLFGEAPAAELPTHQPEQPQSILRAPQDRAAFNSPSEIQGPLPTAPEPTTHTLHTSDADLIVPPMQTDEFRHQAILSTKNETKPAALGHVLAPPQRDGSSSLGELAHEIGQPVQSIVSIQSRQTATETKIVSSVLDQRPTLHVLQRGQHVLHSAAENRVTTLESQQPIHAEVTSAPPDQPLMRQNALAPTRLNLAETPALISAIRSSENNTTAPPNAPPWLPPATQTLQLMPPSQKARVLNAQIEGHMPPTHSEHSDHSLVPSPPSAAETTNALLPPTTSNIDTNAALPPRELPRSIDTMAPMTGASAGEGSASAASKHTSTPTELMSLQLHHITNGSSSIELSVAELGALRIDMETQGERALLHLATERAATGDLIRRNLNELLIELQDAGFADINLSLGNLEKNAEEEGSRQPTPPPSFVALPDETLVHEKTPSSGAGQLYLRV